MVLCLPRCLNKWEMKIAMNFELSFATFAVHCMSAFLMYWLLFPMLCYTEFTASISVNMHLK